MSIFKDLFILIFDECEHLPYTSIPHVHAMFSKTGRGHHAPGTRVTDSCEPPNGNQKTNPSLLQEQSQLLTIGPSFQTCESIIFINWCLPEEFQRTVI